MSTQNRRVATYLPPHIGDRLTAFKSERNIRGDSEALIVVLSEYFQVSQEIAYPSSLNLLQRIEAVEGKLESLKSELLAELKGELSQSSRLKDRSSTQIQKELPISISESLSVSDSSLLVPMNANELAKRLSIHKDTVIRVKSRHKGEPAKSAEWYRSKDPDGIAWEFYESDKLFHPVPTN